jgi:hypothetical protein
MIENSNIPKGLIKVVKPDHPFAYDGPDTLLSDSKGLLAIFTLRDNELKNLNKFFARLTNAIIAYPAHTKMLFHYDQNIDYPNAIHQFGKQFFSDFIEEKDIRKSKSIIKDQKETYKIKEIKNIQRKIFTIQSQIQRDNLDYFKRTNFMEIDLQDIPNLKEKAKYFDRVNQKYVSARANIFSHEDQLYGIKRLSNSSSDIIELQPFYEFVINSEFSVIDGIPYYDRISRKVLNLNEIPRIKFDPLKPTRIASLFGWHLVNSNDFLQIESRISKYKVYANTER